MKLYPLFQPHYRLYCEWQALRLHFTDESYDYFKYQGKTKVTEESFLKSRERWVWSRISNEVPPEHQFNFLLSNLIWNPKLALPKLITRESVQHFHGWEGRVKDLLSLVKQDCLACLYPETIAILLDLGLPVSMPVSLRHKKYLAFLLKHGYDRESFLSVLRGMKWLADKHRLVQNSTDQK